MKTRETPEGDYRFRASIPRAIVADTIRAEVAGISCPNFKSSVQDEDRRYLNVWQDMYFWQERHTPRPRRPLERAPAAPPARPQVARVKATAPSKKTDARRSC
jgi:hypothetical protein